MEVTFKVFNVNGICSQCWYDGGNACNSCCYHPPVIIKCKAVDIKTGEELFTVEGNNRQDAIANARREFKKRYESNEGSNISGAEVAGLAALVALGAMAVTAIIVAVKKHRKKKAEEKTAEIQAENSS